MPAGDEGVLTLSIAMRVSHEPAGIELLKRYNVAKDTMWPLTTL